ncbi:hypothetical protein RhiirC2_798073 [Rhizophagus irregularis]|uniref:Uncharacterized protein n=1 Tax=Rhizophagus irregularis TaxID=588596 RepID=A0A2N1M6Z7_9GLOM|nr:hypothetical protein RhiirC2_798073 [Rhizophagus irregularis]
MKAFANSNLKCFRLPFTLFGDFWTIFLIDYFSSLVLRTWLFGILALPRFQLLICESLTEDGIYRSWLLICESLTEDGTYGFRLLICESLTEDGTHG